MYSENFGGYSANDVPSGSVSTSSGNRVVYNSGSVTYTCTNGEKSGKTNGGTTKIYAENNAGGTSPELLVGKKGGASVAGGTFSISGIPSGGATKLTVSYKQNKYGLSASVSGTGYSGSNSESTAGTKSFDVTVGSASTFTLTFTATSTSNVRLDDISVVVKTAGGGSTKTLVYNANGGSGSMSNTTGASVNAATCTFTPPTCKVFDHWNTAANNSGTSYNEGASVPSSTTLYAIWRNNPSDPTQTFSNGSYTTGGSALNLSSLFSSNSSGAVTYSVTNAGGTGASIAGSSFTATTAGSCTVQALQAADAPCYNAKTATATITVSAPTPATITLQNYDGDATTTGYYSGGSFTLPSENDFVCGDLTFVGWSSVTIDNSATKPSAATYHEPGESVTLGASNTFYAVFAEASGGGGASKTYSFTITGTDIPAPTGGGYQTGSTTSTATATDASGATMDVEWSYADLIRSTTSGYQGYIQFRSTPGYLYNTTDLGAISSIEISNGSNVASFRGTSENPTTDSGKSDGYFRVARSSGTGYAQNITITFTKTTGGGTTYSNYTTNCVNMRTVYLDATEFGDVSGAKFAIYSWENADAANNLLAETFMEKVTSCHSDHLYVGEFPDDHDRVIFLRNAPAAVTPVKEGGNKWNQTSNISTDGDKDLFTIASGGAGDTYTGSWSVYTPYYAVTFDKNGVGETTTWPSDQCIANGGKASEPSSPQTMGKTFVGWYQEAEGTNAWVFNTNTVTAATTIYAKWNDVATKTIYLDTDFGDGDDNKWDKDNVVIFAHAYIDGTSIYTDVKATSAISSCQPHVYAFTIPGNADYVTFARCATGATSIIWDGGSKNVYNKVSLPVQASKDYYLITGWGSNDVSTGRLETTTFTPVSYTISYNAGTSGSGSRDSESKACGVAFTLPNAQVFTRDGYTMDGWATEDGGAKVYNLGGSYTTNAAQTFYPHWTEATYTVTLTTNGGTINADNVTSYVYGTGATLPTNVTKDHATFQGWYASSTFEGGRVYSIGASEFGDKAYWAKWEAITYTVTWKANGSIVRTDNNVEEGGKVASVPSAPADLTTDPNGCDAEFAGWVLEANDPGALSISTQTSTPTGLFSDVAGSPTITANTTFVAIYRQEQ